MNKDRIEGKVKDIAGRIERQAGEWMGDPGKQAQGTVKQVEGKAQNAWGKVKDATDEMVKDNKVPAKPIQRKSDASESDELAKDDRRSRH